MTKEKFTELLENHDWFFKRSDDHGKYTKGLHERNIINGSVEKNPDLKKVLENYIEKRFPKMKNQL